MDATGSMSPGMPLSEIIERVSNIYGVDPKALTRRTRTGRIAEARSILCFLAVRELKYSGASVAEILQMSRAGVSVAAMRGELFILSDPDIRKKIGVN